VTLLQQQKRDEFICLGGLDRVMSISRWAHHS